MLKNLFLSRKFLLALFAVVQTVVLHYAGMPPEIWAAVDIMIITLIGSIAYEDGMTVPENLTFKDVLRSLFASRKFWLTLFGVVQTVVSHYVQIPAEVWVSINALVVIVVGSIAYVDVQSKK